MSGRFKGRGIDWRSAFESYNQMDQLDIDIMTMQSWFVRKFINGGTANV